MTTTLGPTDSTALRDRQYVTTCLENSVVDLADAIDTAATMAQTAVRAERDGTADLAALTTALDDAAAQVRVEAEQLLTLVGWLDGADDQGE